MDRAARELARQIDKHLPPPAPSVEEVCAGRGGPQGPRSVPGGAEPKGGRRRRGGGALLGPRPAGPRGSGGGRQVRQGARALQGGRRTTHGVAHGGSELRDHVRSALAEAAASDAQGALGITLRRPELRERRAAPLCLLVSLGGLPVMAAAAVALNVGLSYPEVDFWPLLWLAAGALALTYACTYWRHHLLQAAVAGLRREVAAGGHADEAQGLSGGRGALAADAGARRCLGRWWPRPGRRRLSSGSAPGPRRPARGPGGGRARGRQGAGGAPRRRGFTHRLGVLSTADGAVSLPLRAAVGPEAPPWTSPRDAPTSTTPGRRPAVPGRGRGALLRGTAVPRAPSSRPSAGAAWWWEATIAPRRSDEELPAPGGARGLRRGRS